MKYNSIALPAPSVGKSFVGQVSLVVPDQSMSLHEILHRFTRGEAIPVGHAVAYDDQADTSDVDLEKVRHMDLVDREEYIDTLRDVQKKHAAQEAAKEKETLRIRSEAAKKAEERRVRIAARKLAKSKDKPGI